MVSGLFTTWGSIRIALQIKRLDTTIIRFVRRTSDELTLCLDCSSCSILIPKRASLCSKATCNLDATRVFVFGASFANLKATPPKKGPQNTGNNYMKRVIAVSLYGALLVVCQMARANVINVLGTGDFAWHNSSFSNNDPATQLAWLQSLIPGNTLGLTPPSTGESDYTGGPIAAGDYLVLHYGAGRGGTQGGGWVGLLFTTGVSSFDVPANGSGPNGFGGLSGATLFDHASVPDGASTLTLMGIGLMSLLGLRRKFNV
jgi:hypothetical protein